jgi:hypothetical protein
MIEEQPNLVRWMIGVTENGNLTEREFDILRTSVTCVYFSISSQVEKENNPLGI